jgi:hypothetical protein
MAFQPIVLAIIKIADAGYRYGQDLAAPKSGP